MIVYLNPLSLSNLILYQTLHYRNLEKFLSHMLNSGIEGKSKRSCISRKNLPLLLSAGDNHGFSYSIVHIYFCSAHASSSHEMKKTLR